MLRTGKNTVFLRMPTKIKTKTKSNIIKSECIYCIIQELYTRDIFMSAGYPADIFLRD